ncbi:MAG: hypothetical protein P8X57_15055 [Cyclobacteriaceae bacterium]
MKFLNIIIIFLFTLMSCQQDGDLTGKWAGRDPDGGYMELWFGDSLALSYFQSYDEFVLYS